MPNPDNIVSFRKGLQVLSSAEDYLSLKNTIVYLLSITEVQDDAMAKDAIATVLRKKQATDIQRFQHYPKELEAIDQRYKDLAVILQKTGAALPNTPVATPALPGNQTLGGTSPLAFIAKLSKSAIIDWIMNNKAVSAGSTAALVGGSYLVYRKFFSDTKEENPIKVDKESNFEKTIRSIQKYRAFSQLSKDPEFDGNYLEVFKGKPSKKKKSTPSKKRSLDDIGNEWDREERALMQNMDVGFNEISIRPRIEFQMPELPAPKMVDANEILGVASPVEEEPLFKKRSKPKREEPKREEKKAKASPQSTGRLVPIVKRTKRIKKVEV